MHIVQLPKTLPQTNCCGYNTADFFVDYIGFSLLIFLIGIGIQGVHIYRRICLTFYQLLQERVFL